MPISGEKASPTPAAVPLTPLSSPYAVTALMKDIPTSGPIANSRSHHAREASSSRHSLTKSQAIGPLRLGNGCLSEGKKRLFEPVDGRALPFGGQRRQFLDRAF